MEASNHLSHRFWNSSRLRKNSNTNKKKLKTIGISNPKFNILNFPTPSVLSIWSIRDQHFSRPELTENWRTGKREKTRGILLNFQNDFHFDPESWKITTFKTIPRARVFRPDQSFKPENWMRTSCRLEIPSPTPDFVQSADYFRLIVSGRELPPCFEA